MTFTYNFGQDDLLHWHQYCLRLSAGGRVQRSRFIVFWNGLYFGLASTASLNFRTWPVIIVSFGVAAGLSFVTPRWYNSRVMQELRRQTEDPQMMGGYGPHQLILSDDGMREITPATDSLVKWEAVTEIVLHADHIFVRLSNGQAAVISRQSCSGPVPFAEIPKVMDEFRGKNA